MRTMCVLSGLVLMASLSAQAEEQPKLVPPLMIGAVVETKDAVPEGGVVIRDGVPCIQPGTVFLVTLTIANASQMPVDYEDWTCSASKSWKTDSKTVATPKEVCTSNIPFTVTIQPKLEHERRLRLMVSKRAPAGPQSFKVGLTSGKEVTWSGPVNIQVELEPPPAAEPAPAAAP